LIFKIICLIFPKELAYDLIEEKPSKTVVDIVSDIGSEKTVFLKMKNAFFV